MKQLKKQLLTASAIVGLSGALSAQVVLTNSDNASFNNATSDTFSYTVQQANSALVIGFYVDSGDSVTGLNFGGVAADNFFGSNRTWIGYWDNPATGSGDLEITGIGGAFGGPDLHVGAYELGNVDLSAPVTSSNDSSITTPTDNEFVISFAGNNGDGTHAPTATSIIDTAVFTRADDDLPAGSNSGGGSVGGGAGLAGLAGSQDVSWDNGDTASYSFQAVPEPSAFALLAGCLGFTWVMLRRR